MIIKHEYDASIRGADWRFQARNGSVQSNVFVPKAFVARRQLIGENCPGWQQKIASGEDATTPMSAKDTVVEAFRPGTARKVYTTGGSAVYETARSVSGIDIIPAIIAPPALRSQTQQVARSKFYGLYQTGPSTDIGVIAVELSGTVQMLFNPYKKLTREVLRWYSRSSKTAERILRSPTLKKLPRQRRLKWVQRQWSSAYLETYFGMLPFMSEIAGILSDLERYITKPPMVQVSVSAHADQLSSDSALSAYISVGARQTLASAHRMHRYIRGAYPVAADVTTDFSVPSVNATIVDVLPALWEAIPYSWLSDYVFNTGHVLAAEQSVQALHWAWLCETEVYTRTDRVTIELYDTQPNQFVRSFDEVPGILVAEHKTVQRSRPQNIPAPSFGLRHKPNTAPFALGAIAAIGQQRFNNLRQRRYYSEWLSSLL